MIHFIHPYNFLKDWTVGFINIYDIKMLIQMKKNKDELIYKLIFSEEVDFVIIISDYIEDIYKYDRFINEIKSVLKKSKVLIQKEKVELDSKTATWTLKVKR